MENLLYPNLFAILMITNVIIMFIMLVDIFLNKITVRIKKYLAYITISNCVVATIIVIFSVIREFL